MERNDFDPSLFLGGSSDPMPEMPAESEPEPIAPPEPAPALTPEPEPEPADITPRERMLLERLERITGEHLEAVPTPPAPTPKLQPPTEHNFLNGLDMDEILSTPENFNKLLLSVYNLALEHAASRSAENIMRSLPETISRHTTQHFAMREMVNQFYQDNPELAQVKRTVAAVANDVAAEKPEFTMEEVFKESAERVYKMLGLRRGASAAAPPRSHLQSGLVAPRGNPTARTPVQPLPGLQNEINELFDIH